MQGSVSHICSIGFGFVIFIPVKKPMEAKASVPYMASNIIVITMVKWFLGINLKAITSAR